MDFSHQGVEYVSITGSDLDRDGMYLEIARGSNRSGVLVEIFFSDETSQLTITVMEQNLPLEFLEWAIERARTVLPPRP